MSTTNEAPKVEEPKKLQNQEIIAQYNSAKQKYSLFFQKAIEIEHELSEHK